MKQRRALANTAKNGTLANRSSTGTQKIPATEQTPPRNAGKPGRPPGTAPKRPKTDVRRWRPPKTAQSPTGRSKTPAETPKPPAVEVPAPQKPCKLGHTGRSRETPLQGVGSLRSPKTPETRWARLARPNPRKIAAVQTAARKNRLKGGGLASLAQNPQKSGRTDRGRKHRLKGGGLASLAQNPQKSGRTNRGRENPVISRPPKSRRPPPYSLGYVGAPTPIQLGICMGAHPQNLLAKHSCQGKICWRNTPFVPKPPYTPKNPCPNPPIPIPHP